MEVEVLLEPRLLEGAGLVDLHPAEALRGDLLDLRGLGLRRKRRDELAGAGSAQPGAREVRHLPDLLCSSFPWSLPSTRNFTGPPPSRRSVAPGFRRFSLLNALLYSLNTHTRHIKRGGG